MVIDKHAAVCYTGVSLKEMQQLAKFEPPTATLRLEPTAIGSWSSQARSHGDQLSTKTKKDKTKCIAFIVTLMASGRFLFASHE